MNISAKQIARFWKHVDVRSNAECWEWKLAIDREGYGATSLYGRSLKAHRVAYYIHYGELDENLMVCHLCDYPRCCNPHHLYQGDHSANMKDMITKGRQHWFANNQPSLSLAAVQTIKELHVLGIPNTRLATMYHVAPRTISQAIAGKTWKTPSPAPTTESV